MRGTFYGIWAARILLWFSISYGQPIDRAIDRWLGVAETHTHTHTEIDRQLRFTCHREAARARVKVKAKLVKAIKFSHAPLDAAAAQSASFTPN